MASIPNAEPSMSTPDENQQLVLDAYAAFAAASKDRIAAYFAPDAEWVTPQRNGTAVAMGTPPGVHGREAIASYLAENLRGGLFSDSQVELRAVIAGGDSVVVEQLYRATVCNGRPYEMVQCFIFVVRDGLIREVRSYFDTALGFEQLFGEEPPRKLI
jgi:ketosteroid isomerase-like protein